MKRIFTSLLAAAAVLGAIAEDTIFNVDGINYKVLGEGAVAVAPNQTTNSWGGVECAYTGDISVPETVEYDGAAYTVTEVADNAFAKGYGMASISLPESITRIGNTAFSMCAGLKSFTVGPNVAEIGTSAFYLCKGIEAYEVAQCNQHFAAPSGVLCDKDVTTLVAAPAAAEVTIPETITDIAQAACTGLTQTSITIPDNVVTIGSTAFSMCQNMTSAVIGSSVQTIGDMAFYSTDKLTSITCRATVPPVLGERVFSSVKNAILYVPKGCVTDYEDTMGWWSFENIQEISEEVGIEVIAPASTAAAYFDLMGRRIANPENGIFVKVQDGKAMKVRL